MSRTGEQLYADRSFVPQHHALWDWNYLKHEKPKNSKSREGNQTIRRWTLQGPVLDYHAAQDLWMVPDRRRTPRVTQRVKLSSEAGP
jgi:hypothetical protein